MAGNPNWQSVALQLAGEGADGGTVITDSSLNNATITRYGAVVTSTAQKLFGSASISIPNASGMRLQVPNDAKYRAAGMPWFYECAIRCGAYSANKVLLDTDADNSNTTGFAVYIGSNGLLYVYQGTTGTNFGGFSGTLTPNQWERPAVGWDGSKLHLFLNGNLLGTVDSGFTNPWSSVGFSLFGDKSGTPAQCLSGYADQIRFTRGVCLHTASYTLEAAAFPDCAGEISGIVRDSSGTPVQRTVRAYHRNTGALIASTSSGLDGSYGIKFATLDELQIVVLDADGGLLLNDLIARAVPA